MIEQELGHSARLQGTDRANYFSLDGELYLDGTGEENRYYLCALDRGSTD